MTRSRYTCKQCGAEIGKMRPSGVVHPLPNVTVVFIDHDAGATTLKCPGCAATMVFRGGRLDFRRARRLTGV